MSKLEKLGDVRGREVGGGASDTHASAVRLESRYESSFTDHYYKDPTYFAEVLNFAAAFGKDAIYRERLSAVCIVFGQKGLPVRVE